MDQKRKEEENIQQSRRKITIEDNRKILDKRRKDKEEVNHEEEDRIRRIKRIKDHRAMA